jgi:hypothetical protein
MELPSSKDSSNNPVIILQRSSNVVNHFSVQGGGGQPQAADLARNSQVSRNVAHEKNSSNDKVIFEQQPQIPFTSGHFEGQNLQPQK